MDKKFKVEVFCERTDLSDLIKKAFYGNDYQLHFNDAAFLSKRALKSLNPECDIIIADNSIETELHEVIKNKFPGVPVICLPALESDSGFDSGVKYISEPFKLSELKKVVAETLIK
jgi:hypothetical protein